MIVNESKCIHLYKKYGSMRCVIDYLGIDIVEIDFKQKTLESRLLIDNEGIATIFILPNTDEYHLEFLLAHELGHYVLHYDTNISFNYFYRIYKTKIEKEANDFACKLLLCDSEVCEFTYKEKGIPENIWNVYINTKQLNYII